MDSGGCFQAGGGDEDQFWILLQFWANCVTRRLDVVFQGMKYRSSQLVRDGELAGELACLSV